MEFLPIWRRRSWLNPEHFVVVENCSLQKSMLLLPSRNPLGLEISESTQSGIRFSRGTSHSQRIDSARRHSTAYERMILCQLISIIHKDPFPITIPRSDNNREGKKEQYNTKPTHDVCTTCFYCYDNYKSTGCFPCRRLYSWRL
jgi:hypothetical protein